MSQPPSQPPSFTPRTKPPSSTPRTKLLLGRRRIYRSKIDSGVSRTTKDFIGRAIEDEKRNKAKEKDRRNKNDQGRTKKEVREDDDKVFVKNSFEDLPDAKVFFDDDNDDEGIDLPGCSVSGKKTFKLFDADTAHLDFTAEPDLNDKRVMDVLMDTKAKNDDAALNLIIIDNVQAVVDSWLRVIVRTEDVLKKSVGIAGSFSKLCLSELKFEDALFLATSNQNWSIAELARVGKFVSMLLQARVLSLAPCPFLRLGAVHSQSSFDLACAIIGDYCRHMARDQKRHFIEDTVTKDRTVLKLILRVTA